MVELTEDDFLNAMQQTKLNQHDIIKILNQKQQILEALELKREIDDIKANMKTSEYLYSGEFSKHIMDRITKIFGDKMIQ